MKRLSRGCRRAKEIINQANRGENFDTHIAGCNECRQTQIADVWMREFAAVTSAPQNLPAPGLLLFKARLVEKQSEASRALQPVVFARATSATIFLLVVGWLLLKSQSPISFLIKEAFRSLSAVAPLLVSGIAIGSLICLAFAYFLRDAKEFKKR